MDEPERPAELSEAAWQATPPEVRVFLALLVAKVAALEARLNQTSQNSSKPPSSDPPCGPPPPVKTPRGKPKAKGAQPGHPDQQRALLPEDQVQQVVTVHPTCCRTGGVKNSCGRCWAHLVRNLRGRAEARGPWQADATALLALAEEVLVIWACYREGALDRATMQGMIQAIEQAMWELVEPGQRQMHTLGSLCADLLPRWVALWTFLAAEGIELTNNAAERALRPAVLWRKGCYGTQSAGGSRFVERMLTVSATCQQHQRPLLPFLVAAVTAYWMNQPAPRLLPVATP